MPTAVGQIRESKPRTAQSGATDQDRASFDHTDAISKVFMMFKYSYHNQYNKAFAVDEDLIITKKYWREQLSAYPAELILRAGESLTSSDKFLPTIADMIDACEQGKELFGLPDEHAAYVEACRAPTPKSAYQWSHPAVYHAGKATGWYLLANQSEEVTYPLFRQHYKRLCQQVLKGEVLCVDAPPPLPQVTEKILSKSELKRRIAQMRKEYKL